MGELLIKFPRYLRVVIPGIVISVVATYLALTRVSDMGQINLSLVQAHYGYILPCAGLLALGVLVRSARWRLLIGETLPLSTSFSIVSATYLLNSILPLRAGEVLRVYLASQMDTPVPVMRSTSTIVLERILDLIAIAALTSAALFFGPVPEVIQIAVATTAPIALVVLVVLIVMARRQQMAENFAQMLARRLGAPQWLVKHIVNFLDGLRALSQSARLLPVLALTALGWGMTLGAGYSLMFMVFPAGSWFAASLFVSAIAFAVAVPAVPGNLGTFELSVILVLGATGFDSLEGASLVFAIALHTIDFLVYLVCGVAGLIRLGISMAKLSHLLRANQS